MKGVSSDARAVKTWPDAAYTDKIRSLIVNIKNIHIDLPGIDSSKGGCGGGGLFNLITLFGCALNKADSLFTEITAEIPKPDIIFPSADDVATSGKAIEEGEENDDDDKSSDKKSDRGSTSTPSSTPSSTSAPSSSSAPPSSSASSSSNSASSSSSVASSTGPSSQYLIYPTAGASSDEINQIASKIVAAVGTDNIGTIALSPSATCFAALMNSTTVNDVKSGPGFPAVHLDDDDVSIDDEDTGAAASGSPQPSSPPARRDTLSQDHSDLDTTLEKRAGAPGTIFQQNNAVPELRFVSQPQGVPIANIGAYVYDSVGGQGITVYVIDTGANKANPELHSMPGMYQLLRPVQTQLTNEQEVCAGYGPRKASGKKSPKRRING